MLARLQRLGGAHQQLGRQYAVAAITDAEKAVAAKLQQGLKAVKDIMVKDTSGGCGAMYEIHVKADDFKGVSTLKQHQMVHSIIKEEIARWHGLTLVTSSP